MGVLWSLSAKIQISIQKWLWITSDTFLLSMQYVFHVNVTQNTSKNFFLFDSKSNQKTWLWHGILDHTFVCPSGLEVAGYQLWFAKKVRQSGAACFCTWQHCTRNKAKKRKEKWYSIMSNYLQVMMNTFSNVLKKISNLRFSKDRKVHSSISIAGKHGKHFSGGKKSDFYSVSHSGVFQK